MTASSHGSRPTAVSHDRVLSLLLRLVGRANPVHFLSQCPPTGEAGPDAAFRREILDRLFPKQGSNILADRAQFDQACAAAAVAAVYLNSDLRVTRPVHVFPVHEGTLDAGFMVPLSVTPARQWEVSDAFGTFGHIELGATPLGCLMDLLRVVEAVWLERYGHTLPARWLRPHALTVSCPIHMDILSGSASAQVPLLVAMLRALGAAADGALPFGDVPVFATGTVSSGDGMFGPVDSVAEKLAAFVRELGPGHPALLTKDQRGEILATNPELLERVAPTCVEGLVDLLAVPVIHDGLSMLASTYHSSMNDRLLTTAASLGKSINFVDAATIDTWVLDCVTGEGYRSEYYAWQTSLRLALNWFHHGRFIEANRYLDKAFSCLRTRPELFGVDDIASMAGGACDMAIDARVPEIFSFADAVSPEDVARMTGPRRVEVFGARCQFHRFFGDIGEAIAAGRKAVAIADSVYASTAGRSRNYLVHALIVAAKDAEGGTRSEFLQEARHHLNESAGPWAPQDDDRSRKSHLQFYQHLDAEIARLTGKSFVPEGPYWRGLWGHAWLFTLLSGARNKENDRSTRERCLKALVSQSLERQEAEGPQSLFGLFHAVYALADAVLSDRDQAPFTKGLRTWLAERAAEGFPGWQDYLAPLVSDSMTRTDIDRLCDAIRYH